MDWLNQNSNAIIVVLTFGLFLATGVYAWVTKRTLNELQMQRINAVRPIVALRWILHDEHRGTVITIINEGAGPAIEIIALFTSQQEQEIGLPEVYYVSALRPGASSPTWITQLHGIKYKVEIAFKDIYDNCFTAIESFNIHEELEYNVELDANGKYTKDIKERALRKRAEEDRIRQEKSKKVESQEKKW